MSERRSREAYYDWRAPEYDDFWLRRSRYASDRTDWIEERDAVLAVVAALPPMRTLDVACGTGFVTSRLRGDVTALDQSARMLEVARTRLADGTLVQGSALELPFADASFDRAFTSHFYGHLEQGERGRFLAEARRVARELVVLDAALHEGQPRDVWQERQLNDGTRWQVFKRFFSPDLLLAELGGGEVLYSGTWFVCVRSPGSS